MESSLLSKPVPGVCLGELPGLKEVPETLQYWESKETGSSFIKPDPVSHGKISLHIIHLFYLSSCGSLLIRTRVRPSSICLRMKELLSCVIGRGGERWKQSKRLSLGPNKEYPWDCGKLWPSFRWSFPTIKWMIQPWKDFSECHWLPLVISEATDFSRGFSESATVSTARVAVFALQSAYPFEAIIIPSRRSVSFGHGA